MWFDALLLSASISGGLLGYRAAASRRRRRIPWSLACACSLIPLAVLYQLPMASSRDRDRYTVGVVIAIVWFVLIGSMLLAIFPRTIAFLPLEHLEVQLAAIVSPDGPIPTQSLAGDLSSALLLAGFGLSLSAFPIRRPCFAALVLTALGFALGFVVELVDRMLQVSRFTGGVVPDLPQGPFATAVLALIAGAVLIAWLYQPSIGGRGDMQDCRGNA